MASPWATSRIQAVVGASWRLRDERVAELCSTWSGPVRRVAEPDDLAGLLLGLDTPSLFEEPALTVVRASAPYLKRHRETLASAIASAVRPGGDGGALLLALAEIDGREALAKTLTKAGALHQVDIPDGKRLSGWLAERLTRHPQGVDRPRQVAEALVGHLGEDVDALLMAIDVVALHAGDRPFGPADVAAVVAGVGERPIWEFTGAVMDGAARRALELLYAGGGMEAPQAVGSLINETRKLIACCDARDDDEAARLAGVRGGAIFYARQRARALGKPMLVRLMTGAYLCQRQLRQSGYNGETALELLVLHAQRMIKPQGR
ncbi:MAG TPA: hypothetical protein VEL07_14240 [Planctomycetota bacterium]|nr:hypothetical protein [Planctomycetota bacterium]